jgi:hypothetical protein
MGINGTAIAKEAAEKWFWRRTAPSSEARERT